MSDGAAGGGNGGPPFRGAAGGGNEVRAVLAGEELDGTRLSALLELHGYLGPLQVEQFGGGYSNLTYLLRVGQQELVLRRPPHGANIKSAHDMGREYKLLSGLFPVYPRVPRPILYCEDAQVLGAPFYIMDRVQGLILRGPGNAQCTPELMAELSSGLIDLLAELHKLDYRAAGFAELGKPEGYVARQVSGWSERWRKAAIDELPEAELVMTWLAANQPPDGRAALIHNDFKYDNLVLDPEQPSTVRAVLDWEMATVGDPLMDLGTTLGYWVEASDPRELQALAFGPTHLPGNLTRAELSVRYAERTGASLERVAFYYAFGLFKIAVIAQQIYARYKRGLTRDPRFKHLSHAVRVLIQQALETGRTGKL